MVMNKLNRCPRCGGNMFLERDLDSLYAECLQCSCRCEITRPADSMSSGIDVERVPVLEEEIKVLSPLA